MSRKKTHLSWEEARWVAGLIREEPNIIGYSPRDWRDFANVEVVKDGDQPAAVSLVHQLGKGWRELAVVYVAPEFRARGYGRQLVERASREAQAAGDKTVLITRTPVMAEMATKLGYRAVDFDALPRSVRWALFKNEWRLYRLGEALRKLAVFGFGPRWQFYVLEPK